MLGSRINRAVFWLYLGLWAVIALPTAALVNHFFGDGGLGLYAGPLAMFAICHGVPRLRDMGRSGWFVAVPFALELLALLTVSLLFPADFAPIMMGVSTVIVVGFIAWLGAQQGEPFPNQFGDPPPDSLRRTVKHNGPRASTAVE